MEAHTPSNIPLSAVTTSAECGVPGLSLLLDFLTAEEETLLLAAVDGGGAPWTVFARRRVQHYGYAFNYVTRGVDFDATQAPFPAALHPILQRLEAVPGVPSLNQLTVNEYDPGVGLSAHIDTHSPFHGAIISLTLAGPATVVMRREGEQRALYLPPRSLLVMDGEARYAWEHYIPHRKTDTVEGALVRRETRRVSFTFRHAATGPCRCAFPQYCDSQGAVLPPTRIAVKLAEQQEQERKELQQQEQQQQQQQQQEQEEDGGEGRTERELQALEDEFVNGVYDAIAPHFSATRFAVWPKVRDFIVSLPPGALVLDVGCGNGKYFDVRRDVFVLGSDRSQGLARLAAKRMLPGPSREAPRADVVVADALHQPCCPGRCDAVLCIAVLHHLSSVSRRLRLLEQLLASLKPGGRAIVTVWATEQSNMAKVAKWKRTAVPGADTAAAEAGHLTDYFVPWHLPFHRAEAAAAAAGARQAPEGEEGPRVDTSAGAVVFSRYYHLFVAGELEGLAAQVAGWRVAESFYDRDNWCVLLEKEEGPST